MPSTVRPAVIARHLSVAADHRERAESLVRGLEVMMAKFTELDVVPLDLLDRFERALVRAHAANLLRLPAYTDLNEEET